MQACAEIEMTSPVYTEPGALLEWLRQTGRLPETLITPAAMDRVAQAVALLPDGVDGWGFECRLDAAQPRVDVGALIRATGTGLPALARAAGASTHALLHSAAASRITSFCKVWRMEGSLLQRFVPFIFLELDCDGAHESVQAPSVFVRLPTPWEVTARTGLNEDTIVAIAKSALTLLSGRALSTDRQQALRVVFDALPAGGRVVHVGLLLGRRNEIRVYASVPRERVAAYLHAVGLGACSDGATAIIERYEPTKPIAELQFDLQPGRSPRLGIELPCQHNVLAERTRRFAAILDRLVSDGLSAPDKRDAVLAWPGIEALPLADGAQGTLIREISHLKIVYETGPRVSAKAYVAVTPRCG